MSFIILSSTYLAVNIMAICLETVYLLY